VRTTTPPARCCSSRRPAASREVCLARRSSRSAVLSACPTYPQGGARLHESRTTTRPRAGRIRRRGKRGDGSRGGRKKKKKKRITLPPPPPHPPTPPPPTQRATCRITETPSTRSRLIGVAERKRVPCSTKGRGRIVDISKYGFETKGGRSAKLIAVGVDAWPARTTSCIGATQGGLIVGSEEIISPVPQASADARPRDGKESLRGDRPKTLRAFATDRYEEALPDLQDVSMPLDALRERARHARCARHHRSRLRPRRRPTPSEGDCLHRRGHRRKNPNEQDTTVLKTIRRLSAIVDDSSLSICGRARRSLPHVSQAIALRDARH